MKNLIYDQWLPYTGDYEKNECDIKLKNGMILKHYYPNAGLFNACCDLQDTELEHVDDDDVAEIMYREYYMKDLCKKESHVCNGVPNKKKMRPIGIIGTDPSVTAASAIAIAVANQHHMPYLIGSNLSKVIDDEQKRGITITKQGTITKHNLSDMIQGYDGPKPIGNLEQPTRKWTIMHNEQTPAVPEMDIEALLGHKEILQDFLIHASTAYKTGIGLAANQVGIIKDEAGVEYKRTYDAERFMLPAFAKKNRETGEWSLILNPKIISTGGLTTEKKEYCLTWPDKVVIADRVYAVEVEYNDINGKKHIIIATGFEAQIWQHEINHLLGIEEVVISSAGGIEHSKEPGRNDPCTCGSGKKYKACKKTHAV